MFERGGFERFMHPKYHRMVLLAALILSAVLVVPTLALASNFEAATVFSLRVVSIVHVQTFKCTSR